MISCLVWELGDNNEDVGKHIVWILELCTIITILRIRYRYSFRNNVASLIDYSDVLLRSRKCLDDVTYRHASGMD